MKGFNYTSALRNFAESDKKTSESKKSDSEAVSSADAELEVQQKVHPVEPEKPVVRENPVASQADLQTPEFDISNESDMDDFKNDSRNISSPDNDIIDVPIPEPTKQNDMISEPVEAADSDDSDDYQDDDFESVDDAEDQRRRNEEQLREQTSAYNKRNIPKNARRAAKIQDDSDAVSVIKNMPTCIVQHIKSMFPGGVTQSEALAAYVYIKEGRPDSLQVSERIRDVADSYKGDASTIEDLKMDLESQIRDIKQKNARMFSKLESIELGVVYTIFDRAGFRKEDMPDPGSINFLEGRIMEMAKQLDKQAADQHMRDSIREGRPKS